MAPNITLNHSSPTFTGNRRRQRQRQQQLRTSPFSTMASSKRPPTGMDMISGLPLDVLHRILSYLPPRELAFTSVLSKHWNSVRNSYPVVQFGQPRSTTYLSVDEPCYKGHLRRLLRPVHESLQRLARSNLNVQKFCLTQFYIDQDWVPLVDMWLHAALHNGVEDIHFHVNLTPALDFTDNAGWHEEVRSLVQRLQLWCRAARFHYPLSQTSFALDSSQFFRLENLVLIMVCLSERIVGDIIKNCPCIRVLSLEQICGLKMLSISKLDKLESLTVSVAEICWEFGSFSVDALSLEKLAFTSESSSLICDIDLICCSNLRKLELTRSSIVSERFNELISRSPLLELLDIELCKDLARIQLPLQRLKHLRVIACRNITAIEIDSPALLTIDFVESGTAMPVIVASKLNFFPGELRNWVNYPQKMGCLDLRGLKPWGVLDCVYLLEELLLSSCHPRIVWMSSDSTDLHGESCAQIFCQMLLHSRSRYPCSGLRCKCWHRHLKDVKIDSIRRDGKIKRKLVLDPMMSVPRGTDVRFRLYWDLSWREGAGNGLDRFSISSFIPRY